MKKYISLLSIAAAFMMFSCERSQIETEENLQNSKQMERNHLNRTDSTQFVNPINEQSDPPSNVDPGGDDEPERDKQHWRVAIKS